MQGCVRTGDDVALNSPLRASFSLSLSCLDLVGLKAARDGQVESVFLIDLNISLLIRDQEDSHHRGLMSKSSISLKYWPLAPLFKSS